MDVFPAPSPGVSMSPGSSPSPPRPQSSLHRGCDGGGEAGALQVGDVCDYLSWGRSTGLAKVLAVHEHEERGFWYEGVLEGGTETATSGNRLRLSSEGGTTSPDVFAPLPARTSTRTSSLR